MKIKRRFMIAVGTALALAAGGIGAAVASGGGDDGDERASGPGADSARSAALALVPGQANSVERDSENGATWEVEITRQDGSGTVDVRLDANNKLVVVEGDSEPNGDSK